MFVRWCVCLVVVFSFSSSLWSQQIPNELHESEKLLVQTEELIQAIQEGGDDDSAKAFLERLRVLRAKLEETDIPVGEEAELHAVSLLEGTNAPAGVLEGRDRFVLGYAKVNVNFTKRPIVLLLSSNQALLWDVQLAKGVTIKAAIVWNRGQDKSRVRGLPRNVGLARAAEEQMAGVREEPTSNGVFRFRRNGRVRVGDADQNVLFCANL